MKNDNRQLLVWVKAWPQGQKPVMVQALIDTGAETNLIRTKLLPPHYFSPSKSSLQLITADGSVLKVGKREVTLQLCLHTLTKEVGGSVSWCTQAVLLEADIGVDIILGYPWLEKAKVGVFPHLEALAHMGEAWTPFSFCGVGKTRRM